MKVAFTKIKIYDELSRETVCFTAVVSLDGEKIHVKNDGNGGCNDYSWDTFLGKQKFEKWCCTLVGENNDPDYAITTLILQEDAKKKNQKKAIVYEDANGEVYLYKYKIKGVSPSTIMEYMQLSPSNREKVIAKCKEIEEAGGTILNDNLLCYRHYKVNLHLEKN
jgi:hypothetical protein